MVMFLITDANKKEITIIKQIARKIPPANANLPLLVLVRVAAIGIRVKVSSKPAIIFTKNPEKRYFNHIKI